MNFFKKKSLTIATAVYWILLVYIIAALVWWFIALQTQNRQMTTYKLLQLKADTPDYITRMDELRLEERHKTAQYIGEGLTFLLLIVVGAMFVYRAVRRQFKQQQQQHNFMTAVTHELKTPIAIARLNLETLQKHKLEEVKQQKIIQVTLLEINRLNTLTTNILVTSQLDGGEYSLSKEELDLSALTANAVNDFKNRFPERTWYLVIEPELPVIGDTLLLQMLVSNLVENAVKYSPKQSAITITLKKESTHTVLRIKDEGAGIRNDEKKKIFEKFYRIGNEETRTTQGTGLGLYLCKKIAADHKAHITVTDNTPTGSIFTVLFR